MQKIVSKLPLSVSILNRRLTTGLLSVAVTLGLGLTTSTTVLSAECENPDSLTFAIIPT